jgi:hypothetical protein
VGLSSEEREKVMFSNARRFFGLRDPEASAQPEQELAAV